MRAGTLAATTLLALGCTACDMSPMTVREVPPPKASHASTPVFCRLLVDPLIDQRLDPTTLGAVGGRSVHAPADPAMWLRNELLSLNPYGVIVQFAGNGATTTLPSLDAAVELQSAWLNSFATSKMATVAMSFDYRRQGQSILKASYRGNRTVINWNGTDSEIQSALDEAFTQVMDQAVHDIRRLCTSTPAST